MEVIKKIVRLLDSGHSGNVAIRADGKSYSYSQIFSSAQSVSNLLLERNVNMIDRSSKSENCFHTQNNINTYHGSRIGIVAKPSAEFVAGIFGAWLSGCIAVPLALGYPRAELLHVINDSDSSMILSTEDQLELLQSVAENCSARILKFSSVPHMTPQSNECNKEEAVFSLDHPYAIEADNKALIIYTSGTTGKPKGVVHTHKSIGTQVQMLVEAWEYTQADQLLNCLPLHHVHGLFNALLAPLYAGSTVEFMPRFSVKGIWERWRESYPEGKIKAADAISVFTGVPTMYSRLIQSYQAMDQDLQSSSAYSASKLRLMMCGSSALPFPVMQQWKDITGHVLLERYGMTEFVMAISNPLRGSRKGGTVGVPFPGVQAKVLPGGESGIDATIGELCVKSPSMFKEYWKLPKVTSEAFMDGGFFKTGDTVKVDEDGYYIILGRTNADIMKVGGYKLSALEIEAVIMEHPAVAECSVLGLPDKDYGEVVCAIIVADAETHKKRREEMKPVITLQELHEWAKEKLAPYKLPAKLMIWSSIPRNAMGKVNKKDLKAKLLVLGEEL